MSSLICVIREIRGSLLIELNHEAIRNELNILFDMGKMRAPVKFVEQAKRESSKFIKTLGADYKQFFWQRGYSMFSVGPTRRAEVKEYVRNQAEHHRKTTFQPRRVSRQVDHGAMDIERYLR